MSEAGDQGGRPRRASSLTASAGATSCSVPAPLLPGLQARGGCRLRRRLPGASRGRTNTRQTSRRPGSSSPSSSSGGRPATVRPLPRGPSATPVSPSTRRWSREWRAGARWRGSHRCRLRGKNTAYHWPSVANAALASILRFLFPIAPREQLAALAALEERLADDLRPRVPGSSRARSSAGERSRPRFSSGRRATEGMRDTSTTSRRTSRPSATACGCRRRPASFRRCSPPGAGTAVWRSKAGRTSCPGITHPTPRMRRRLSIPRRLRSTTRSST